MIQIIPSEQRYKTSLGWLTSYHSFSFANYYDPENTQFGALRVFNDDLIQPGKGFDMHPHAEMEIMTYVIEGALEHRDSLGNKGIIQAGEVQRMSAGTGIYHSEYNYSDENPLRLLQIWFLPQKQKLTPSWEQKHFSKEQQLNRLLPVVSGHLTGEALKINQDVTVYLSCLEPGAHLSHHQDKNRRIYLFVINGELQLDQHYLRKGDTARITERHHITISSHKGAELMLIDLA